MRPFSQYLDEIVNEQVNVRYNLAGSTPPALVQPAHVSVGDARAKARIGLARFLGALPEQIALCPGSSQALFHVLAAITQPGDSIAIESPVYEPFLATARFLGLKVLRFKRTGHFAKDFAAIRKISRKVRVILISNPHCPTGVMFSSQQLNQIGCLKPKLIVDEVYLPLFKDGRATLVKNSGIVSIGGLSKPTGLASARVGWVKADKDTICRVNQIALNLNIDMSSQSLQLLLFAIKNWQRIIKPLAQRIAANTRLLNEFDSRRPGAVFGGQVHGSICALKIPKEFSSAASFTRRLRRRSVWVRTGELFEMPRYYRIHTFLRSNDFAKALKIIEKYYQ